MSFLIKHIREDDDETSRILCNECTSICCTSFIKIGVDEICMPIYYEKYAEQIKNLEVYDDDVWVSSFPKSGTTWMQELVWLVKNDMDFKAAREKVMDERFPFVDMCTIVDYAMIEKIQGVKQDPWIIDSVTFAKEQKRPRLIKTHLPLSLLPEEISNGAKTPKVIHVIRNPKDVCVSYFHHLKLFQPDIYTVDLGKHVDLFINGKLSWGPYWKSVFSYWKHRNQPNFLIVNYEDMKKDLTGVIQTVAKFLERTVTDEQIALLCEHLSFKSMKANPSTNNQAFLKLLGQRGDFIRTGKVGKYGEELTEEMIAKLNAWIKENIVGTSYENEFNFNL